MKSIPVRKIPLGSAAVLVARRQDGAILLRSPDPLGPYPATITDRLVRWAAECPQRVFLAQREKRGGWRELSYGDAYERVRALGQALLDRGLSSERPLAILSENDIEHALLALAAMHVGIPYAPVSPAYSLVSRDYRQLRYIVDLLRPGLVFAADGSRYADSIAAAVPPETEIVVAGAPDPRRAATLFDTLQDCAAGQQVDAAHAGAGPATVAKILFTSGSTGQPKGVINTQRMLCSNQQMVVQAMPIYRETPLVLVDWLPWHHTAGGNNDFGLILYNGGTLYVDEGRPLPGLIEETVRNLREIAPTVYINVPRGYEALLPYLRSDAALRKNFFSRLRLLFYAGAALAQPVWEAYQELARLTCGERLVWSSGLGSTETAPFAMCTNEGASHAGAIGVPAAGVELKLVPAGDKLEARFRGPSITPGYWRAPELTRAAFDEEGYYRMGDAMRFIDPEQPHMGLEFDGRIAEDFKLSSATWVSVGPLRIRFLAACAPLAQDVVFAGHDRDEVTALVFPDMTVCRGLCPDLPRAAPAADVLAHPSVRGRFQEMLDRLAGEATGSSSRIVRAMLLDTPASIDDNEITDKGSVNQRMVLEHRAGLVEELYSQGRSPRVIHARWTENTR